MADQVAYDAEMRQRVERFIAKRTAERGHMNGVTVRELLEGIGVDTAYMDSPAYEKWRAGDPDAFKMPGQR